VPLALSVASSCCGLDESTEKSSRKGAKPQSYQSKKSAKSA
jgi:hypothetical protein